MEYTWSTESGKQLRLRDCDPGYHAGMDREKAADLTTELGREAGDLGDMLYSAGMHALLIVLQGRDTAGKDGLIRRILTHVNAQSCRVAPFKVPTATELEHDFLWRVHAQVPGKGSIALFNRSHYEDVLVVRVHELVREEVWRRRYAHINAFEELLLDSNVIVLKFLLHISKEEQKERLLDREKEPEKAWKLNVGDWQERELWNAYEDAYDDVLRHCSSERAPWYVVPANHKWFRDLAVMDRIVRTLRPYRKEWFQRLEGIGEQMRDEIAKYRAAHSD